MSFFIGETADAIIELAFVHIPNGMRPKARGISHGLKSVPRTLFLTAFRFPHKS